MFWDSFKINPTYNSDGLINCLLQPGQFYLSIQKSLRVEFNPLIKSCATRPDSYRDDPAAKTKSIGLQADARVVMVFARHLDNFIMTWQILTTYRDHAIWTVSSWHQTITISRDFAKTHANPDTDGN